MDETSVHHLNPGGPTTPHPPHWVNPGWSGSGRWTAPAAAPAASHPGGAPFSAQPSLPTAVPIRRRRPWATRADWRTAAVVVLALAVVGAVLGVVWQAWSPPGPLGLVIQPGAIEPDETEAFIAGDGRFAVLALAVGLVAGIALWWHRPSRGPLAVLALGVGGLLGAYLMALVGHLVRGGSDSGKSGTLLQHVPLQLHAHGLLVLEAAIAVLGYVICAAFAARDDLGRREDEQPAYSDPARS